MKAAGQNFPVVHISLCCFVFAIQGGCFESVMKHSALPPVTKTSAEYVQSESISWAFEIGLQLKESGNLLFGLISGKQVRFHR